MHKVVSIALGEVGYLEKHTPEQLDDKLSNPGQENYTKYARDMAAHLGFYLGSKPYRSQLQRAGLSERKLRRMDPNDRVRALERAKLNPYDFIFLAC